MNIWCLYLLLGYLLLSFNIAESNLTIKGKLISHSDHFGVFCQIIQKLSIRAHSHADLYGKGYQIFFMSFFKNGE